MKIISIIKSASSKISLAWAWFVFGHQRRYLTTTALIGVISLILFFNIGSECSVGNTSN